MHSHHSLSESEAQSAQLRALSSLKGLPCNGIHALRLTRRENNKTTFLYGGDTSGRCLRFDVVFLLRVAGHWVEHAYATRGAAWCG